jgi:transcription elongation factor Elf1
MNTQMCTVCNKETNIVHTYPSDDGSRLVTICSNCGVEIEATEEVELNEEQADRVDEVYNAVYDMCKVLTENDNLEWNMVYLGEIAEFACNTLLTTGAADKIRFPAVVEADNYGSQCIEEYYTAEQN